MGGIHTTPENRPEQKRQESRCRGYEENRNEKENEEREKEEAEELILVGLRFGSTATGGRPVITRYRAPQEMRRN